MMLSLVLAAALSAAPEETPDPQLEVARVGAIFAAGVLDLISSPKRDVTVSFATLVSAPIGYPKPRRAAEFNMLATSLDEDVRELNPRLIAQSPGLVGICVVAEGATRWALEALVQGKTRAWTMQLMADTNLFGTPSGGTRPPQLFFAALTPLNEVGAVSRRLAAKNCSPLARDEAGELLFNGEPKPSRFEGEPGTPWPSGSDHLLDFAEDPDLAVGGLMPAQRFAELHPELPRPRAAGVLSLVAAAQALSNMGGLTLVAAPPTANGSVVFFVDGKPNATAVGFSNGYFTTPQVLAPGAAIPGPWSRWSWSLINPSMPAEVLLDLTPPVASCLDALPKKADAQLTAEVQKCFDLALADAGPSFRVRRERWLEQVRAHERAAAKSIESFCADQAALAAQPFFQNPAKRRDAGPMLTAVLGWEERKDAKKVPGSLKLPADLDQKFGASGFMDLSDKDLALTSAADTGFFAKLERFDRWELTEGQGPLTAAAKLNAANAPFPQFARLSLAARLHLRRNAKTGKLVQAGREVRQAARIAFNSETLVGQSLALGLLTIEWRAWQWAQQHNLPTPDWEPIDDVTIERARRVLRTAPAFFSPMTSEETFARAVSCDQVTSCAAYTEVTAFSAGLESMLREPWKARYATVLSTLSKPHERCGFGLARHWSTRPMLDVAEAKRSRTQEVIAGEMMRSAAERFTLPALLQFYP